MTVLAAVLAAALAASAAPAVTPAPAPAPGAGAGAPAAAPAGKDGQAALRQLLARELPALPPRPFRTASGLTGKVEAAGAPKVDVQDGAEALTVPLGTAEPISCAVFPNRLDAAAVVWRIAEATKEKVKLVSALPVDFLEVKGSALVLAQLAYQVDGAQGPLLGVMKLAVYVHPSRSLLCSHDEPGYAETFARIVKGLAGSLAGGAPDPRAGAIFAELSVVRIGPLPVGYAEHVVMRREGGGLVSEQYGAQLLPRGAADLVAVDSSQEEALDGKDLLERGTYVHVTNGDLDLKMSVARGQDGRTYTYDGEKDGKALQGSFPTKAGVSTDLWFARRFARAAPPVKGELRHEGYSAEANPVAAVPVVYRREPGAARRATMELGPITLTGDLDAHGLFETAEVPVGPSKLVVKRLWSRGAP
jgi:hypothetical protein